MPKIESELPGQKAIGDASRKRLAASKPVSGVVKKKSADSDYKKKRKRLIKPQSEEAIAKRRAAAQQAAATRKKNEGKNPRQRRNQVYVNYRRAPSYKPGAPKPKMHQKTSGRLVDIGSEEHNAAKTNSSIGVYRYWLGGPCYKY